MHLEAEDLSPSRARQGRAPLRSLVLVASFILQGRCNGVRRFAGAAGTLRPSEEVQEHVRERPAGSLGATEQSRAGGAGASFVSLHHTDLCTAPRESQGAWGAGSTDGHHSLQRSAPPPSGTVQGRQLRVTAENEGRGAEDRSPACGG